MVDNMLLEKGGGGCIIIKEWIGGPYLINNHGSALVRKTGSVS